MYKKANESCLDFMEVEESGHLKTALDAFRQLIVEKLDSSKRTRFSSVASLCEVAQSLMRAEAKPRVPRNEDKADYEGEADGEYVGNFGNNMAVIGQPMMFPDTKQMRRNMDIQMGALSQVTIETQRAQWASAEAQELRDLMTVRDSMGNPKNLEILNNRIHKLIKNIEGRTDGNLVHSELSRGSSTGSDKSNGNVPADVQPVERGTEGTGSLQKEGSEGRDNLQAVGDG